MRVVIGCFGNPLRGDDGVGPAVAARLCADALPAGVVVMDVGIGGIHLVQELFDPADALVLVDAVDLGRPPGTVIVMTPDVDDVRLLDATTRRDVLADMHYATPEKALQLADGLDVLPASRTMIAVQVADAERYGEGLSPAVAGAVDVAIAEVRTVVAGLGVSWEPSRER